MQNITPLLEIATIAAFADPHSHHSQPAAIICLLLLDEWLAGLNPTELAHGIDPVQTICQSGVTMILVEHAMLAVHTLCDRVIVMDAGSKVAEGSRSARGLNSRKRPGWPLRTPEDLRRDPRVVESDLGTGHIPGAIGGGESTTDTGRLRFCTGPP